MAEDSPLLAIAAEAYEFLYPLVLMDLTRLQQSRVKNAWQHNREYPPGRYRGVVRPNFDTLYSIAWLDLTDGPVAVDAPDTAGRYYCMHMMDMWTDSFAVPGSRTWGTGENTCVVVGPHGTPAAVAGAAGAAATVLQSSTPFVWIINRIQTHGAPDYPAVHKLQDGFVIRGLRGEAVASKQEERSGDKRPPMIQARRLPAKDFFEYAARLLAVHPPRQTDGSIMLQLRHFLGLTPGHFEFRALPADVQEALTRGKDLALARLRRFQFDGKDLLNGWQVPVDGVGVYGNSYRRRAAVAMGGLGAVPPEDAVYSTAVGEEYDCDGAYEIRFATAADLPPCDAFWSITVYDRTGYPSENKMERYAVGSLHGLAYEADGSLVIHVQQASPGAGREANWLPLPKGGKFSLSGRFYAPRSELLERKWKPPRVQRVSPPQRARM